MSKDEIIDINRMKHKLDQSTQVCHKRRMVKENLRVQMLSLEKKVSPHEVKAIIKTSKGSNVRNIQFVQKSKEDKYPKASYYD